MSITDFLSDLSFHLIPGVFYFSKVGKRDVCTLINLFFPGLYISACLRILSCLKVIKIVSQMLL